MGIGYMALWGFEAKCWVEWSGWWSGVDWIPLRLLWLLDYGTKNQQIIDLQAQREYQKRPIDICFALHFLWWAASVSNSLKVDISNIFTLHIWRHIWEACSKIASQLRLNFFQSVCAVLISSHWYIDQLMRKKINNMFQ